MKYGNALRAISFPGSGRLGWLSAGIAALLAAAGVLGTAEFCARRALAARGGSLPRPEDARFNTKYLYLDIHKPFLRRMRDASGAEVYVNARPYSLPIRMAARKPAGVVRIFIVGGSVAVNFAERNSGLEEILAGLSPGRRYEVVSFGMHAYDSYRDRLVFEEALDYEPDAVVVMSGNNEEFYERSVINPWRARFERLAGRLALARLLARNPSKAPGGAFDRRQEFFSGNLSAMARAGAERGVTVVICTMPHNMADSAPHHQVDMSAEYLRARTLLETGNAPGAAAVLRRYVKGAADSLPALYLLGKAEQLLGRYERAAENFGKVIEEEARRRSGERCPESRNELIRAVAARGRAALCDLQKSFRGRARHGLTGFEEFRDGVHWHYSLNKAVACEILLSLARSGRLGALTGAGAGQTGRLEQLGARYWGTSIGFLERRACAAGAAEWTVRNILNGAPGTEKGLNEWWIWALQVSLAHDSGYLKELLFSGGELARLAQKAGNCDAARLTGFLPVIYLDAGEAFRRSGDRNSARRAFGAAARAGNSALAGVLEALTFCYQAGPGCARSVLAAAAGDGGEAAALARALAGAMDPSYRFP